MVRDNCNLTSRCLSHVRALRRTPGFSRDERHVSRQHCESPDVATVSPRTIERSNSSAFYTVAQPKTLTLARIAVHTGTRVRAPFEALLPRLVRGQACFTHRRLRERASRYI